MLLSIQDQYTEILIPDELPEGHVRAEEPNYEEIFVARRLSSHLLISITHSPLNMMQPCTCNHGREGSKENICLLH